jgi:hypothetical protein
MKKIIFEEKMEKTIFDEIQIHPNGQSLIPIPQNLNYLMDLLIAEINLKKEFKQNQKEIWEKITENVTEKQNTCLHKKTCILRKYRYIDQENKIHVINERFNGKKICLSCGKFLN